MTSMDRNTSPISPFSEENYTQAYKATSPHLYPEEELPRFKKTYGQINNFKADEIELANGSDEWLQKLMITLGDSGVMTLTPDFNMYENYANQIGVTLYKIQSDQNFVFDFKQIISEIKQKKPSLFILSNPHNPTSIQFSEIQLQDVADAMESVDGYFVIDEAYIEFGKDYSRPKGKHVIILRTMSKIYGMAGLRIGVIQALAETYQKLTSINHPYPLNNLNLNLASEFLENEEKRSAFISYQKKAQEELIDAFQLVEDRVTVKSSSTNFVFTYGENAESLGLFLKEKGFNGRFYDEENLKNAVRYSIIKLDEYPRLVETIKEWKQGLENKE